MAAINPRINVVFERAIYRTIEHLAKADGVSLSLKVRELVKEALEDHEDMVLAQFGDDRAKTFDRKKALTHKQVWSHLNH